MEKPLFGAGTVGRIVSVVAVILTLAYLGFARFSSQTSERYTPSVDGDCVDRLTIATNGKITTEELQQRCVR